MGRSDYSLYPPSEKFYDRGKKGSKDGGNTAYVRGSWTGLKDNFADPPGMGRNHCKRMSALLCQIPVQGIAHFPFLSAPGKAMGCPVPCKGRWRCCVVL